MSQSRARRPMQSPKTIQLRSGAYRDVSLLHSSSHGGVYKAFSAATGRAVVLKIIDEGVAGSRGLSTLRNEYRILSKIRSQYIPGAIEYSTLGADHCLVREYSDGLSLHDFLEGRPISIQEFLDIARQIVHALSDIHNADVIHKDINPGNIVYDTATRRVTVIDFGSATEFSHGRSPAMESNLPEGGLWYISPEQTGRMNHTVDFRTDFYSLGVTFYEMLCGCRPYESEDQSRIVYMHLARSPPQAHAVNRSVPPVLSRLIARLMAKMPEDRYQSPAGIAFDLDRCLETHRPGDAWTEFDLGAGDYSGRFEVPQRTYGRDAEVAALETAFAEVSRGRKELVAIAGHPGTGKTTLVGELYTHLAGANGILVGGAYDQYRRNVPFAAISRALEQFCELVLSESTSSLNGWKARIAASLKKDGRLLVGRIPKLGLLMGEPDALPELSPIEERARFRTALQELLAAIASPDRALVMFLDDMHLASAESFELIEEIMGNTAIRGLLMITCYRDNEVDEGHPLVLSLRKMTARRINIRRMTLAGLDPGSAARMVADTLRRDVDTVRDLAATVYGKTGGNPFYLRQFLRLCHANGHVRFDHEARSWMWEIDPIRRCEAEENVVDFLVRNLDQVPPQTRSLLSLGACIGRTFSVRTLAGISGRDSDSIVQDMKPAVGLELAYFVGGGEAGDGAEFQFAHDRFQQTFFTILSERERNDVHCRLSVFLEESGYGEDARTERLFVLADSYSKAFSALPGKAQRRRAAEVLLRTAKAASLRSSFGMALRYLELINGSLEVLDADREFVLAAMAEYHSALCSTARYAEADAAYARLEGFAREPLLLTDNCCLQAISLSNRGRYKDAFMLGVELLGKLGVHFPAEDLQGAVAGELGAFYAKLGGDAFPGVEQLPRSHDVVESSIAKILNRISAAGLFYNPFCAFWAIVTNAKRVLDYGYTRDGLPLYGSLTLLLVPFKNDYRLSYNLALGAMKLAERNGYRVYRMYHLFSLINSHWYEDWKTGISYARESCRGNTAFGDFEFACFSYFTTQQLVLETCSSLEELVEETTAALVYAERHGNLHARRSFVSFRQLSRSLIATLRPTGSFDDGDFSESEHLEDIAGNQMALCFYYILRALSATIYLDFGLAFELTEKAIPCMPSITGFYFTALHKFLHSLSICKRIESGTCSPEQEAALADKRAANQKWLGERAADAPMNFMHLFDLIEAERSAGRGQPADLLLLHEKAVAGARKNGRPYHYAMACDLAAQRFLTLGAPVTAAGFLREAHRAYGSWGAKGKVEHMRREFVGQWPSGSEEAERLSPIPLSIAGRAFDLNSLLQASQAISRETRIEAVLASLMNVLRENAGAENIYYLTEREGAYSIMAECHAEGEPGVAPGREPNTAGRYSAKIVNYVARAREAVVLDNAAASDAYGSDVYIAGRRSKSVMCIPIASKGGPKGVLYLENNLIEGAFDRRRIDALNTIATQLAISLENAYLFDNLQQAVDERTRELQERVNDLQEALANIKTLEGLLPICAWCQKIRDDHGYWRTVERYFADHTPVQFSHSICPDCTRKLYPDLVEDTPPE